MRKVQLRITLLSDLCVSDGNVYNSSIDTEICYDSYGIPFIPSKRIRGCLRECALELKQMGIDIDEEEMFGNEDKQSEVFISDAFPEQKEELIKQVIENPGHPFFHPLHILDYFSYVRTQTEIDYETGSADEGSLRTVRVIKKGLSFVADVEISDSDKMQENLKSCLKIFTHLGLARTRGLGEIRAVLRPEIIRDSNGTDREKQENDIRLPGHEPLIPDSDRLDYQIELIDPVICKSLNGEESRSLDYIEGSKIFGLLLEAGRSLPERQIFFEDECFFSNAYIAVQPAEKSVDSTRLVRCEEVPASIYNIKGSGKEFRDKLFDSELHREEDYDRQLTQMKHCYMLFDKDMKPVFRKDVSIEERYHHRRPDDKSIGKALNAADDTNSNFYQISSIRRGQVFAGYIAGSIKQIELAWKILSSRSEFRIGYGRTSEYGRVRIRITKTSKSADRVLTGKRFAVRLVSPVIVYNKKAFYSTDQQDLFREIRHILGIKETISPKKTGQFIRYTSVGGYNVTWGKRKPVVQAFDKGTVIWFEMGESLTITIPGKAFVGERIQEGYGEITVYCVDEEQDRYSGNLREEDGIVGFDCLKPEHPVVHSLCMERFFDYVDVRALEAARRDIQADKYMEDKSTISNMLLMCAENDKVEGVKASVQDRFADKSGQKTRKLETAEKILSIVDTQMQTIVQDFCSEYKVSEFSVVSPEMRFLTAYLKHAKYILRQREEGTPVV